MIEILFLSLVQGVTEFIPVSSSSHLLIISTFFKFSNQDLSIDISLHIGSFIAILFYFRNELINFIKNKELFIKIFISSIPVIIVGFILVNYNLIDQLRNIKVVGWMTIIFGILLFLSDKFDNTKTINKNFNLKAALFIGFLQVLSLIPGVSRAGIAITASRMLKFERVESAKISFLLSIPTLAAVSLYGAQNIFISKSFNFSILNLVAIFFSFIFSYITIKFFLEYLKKFSLDLFVLYRILLGVIILLLAYLK